MAVVLSAVGVSVVVCFDVGTTLTKESYSSVEPRVGNVMVRFGWILEWANGKTCNMSNPS